MTLYRLVIQSTPLLVRSIWLVCRARIVVYKLVPYGVLTKGPAINNPAREISLVVERMGAHSNSWEVSHLSWNNLGTFNYSERVTQPLRA